MLSYCKCTCTAVIVLLWSCFSIFVYFRYERKQRRLQQAIETTPAHHTTCTTKVDVLDSNANVVLFDGEGADTSEQPDGSRCDVGQADAAMPIDVEHGNAFL